MANLWHAPSFWLNWGATLIGLTALVLIAIRTKGHGSKHFWRVGMVYVVAVYLYQLYPQGLFIDGASIQQNMLILANYLFLVAPPLSAITYWAFTKTDQSEIQHT